MNISRPEQRVLHVLALGGRILHERGNSPKVISVTCITRDGMVLFDCNLTGFNRLRKKRLIESQSGSPIASRSAVASLCLPNSTIRVRDILIQQARSNGLHRDPMQSVHDTFHSQSQGT